MKKNAILIGTLLSASFFVGGAHAQEAKSEPFWLCSDYLAADTQLQPVAIGYAEALNRIDQTQTTVLDVEGIVKVTPVVHEYCKENPKVALRDALKQSWGTIKP
ncbi:acid-activated periplasmic chaperone HdeA [Alcaligenes endophyticus]|uniref:HdeA family protein n=1 Tax=Alcaligenes endophyticus TaxID=1929088 RepID=A0ABT8EMM8_9BURK|nr:acid-activated periplasmic chaperone HdeA [Alcaligenes endophyticus]MCX5591570.1 acid-activated periplasmic chaperone HdeA [Alcaligenes endophyticus]MDN4122549.1 HdeA family protein [Alcaligenes endophyticus]